MRNLIAVAFVEPVAEGLEFPRDDWPLHLTLVKFDVVKAGVVKSGVVEPGQETRAEPAPGTPKAFDDYIRAETRKWAQVIKTAGIKLD